MSGQAELGVECVPKQELGNKGDIEVAGVDFWGTSHSYKSITSLMSMPAGSPSSPIISSPIPGGSCLFF